LPRFLRGRFRVRTPAPPRPAAYERRRPEKTPLYKIVAECLEGWLEDRSVREQPVAGYVEEEFRGYLTCGLLCFGFARALCTRCPPRFVVAFSCKRRGVCPSCNGRHMAQPAAHLADHVIPPVPVRQWVISVPKRRRSRQRLRGMLADRPRAVVALTKIFLTEIEQHLLAAAGGPLMPRHRVHPARGSAASPSCTALARRSRSAAAEAPASPANMKQATGCLRRITS
jgi:hypothetical protein